MTSPPAYKVVALEPGLAWVYDRATRERVGYVVHMRSGWQARGDDTTLLGVTDSRADAARMVWEAAS